MKMQEHQLVPYQTSVLPVDQGPWLVLAPHADDESFGMGGTLAKAADAGIQTHLWVLTDGALGGTGADLVLRRRQEALDAARVLGMEGVQFHHQPDRQLGASSSLLQSLSIELKKLHPAAVFFPGIHELHPDHRACALLAWQLLRQMGDDAPQALSYEISGQSAANCLVDISSTMSRKLQALGVYHSQLDQNNYIEIVMSLNKLRTFTLAANVKWAEAFYRYSRDELQEDLPRWAAAKVCAMLAW
jgi:LmbE family N-acetylglucosaminyl deacetylase